MSATSFSEFSKPFIDAAKKVYETMVYTKLIPQKPFLKSDSMTTGDVSAVLGVSGVVQRNNERQQYQGILVMSWPYDTYVKMASAMLMEEHKEYSKAIADAGGEIVNMVMGNAKRTLSEMGHTTNMAVPSMIEGKGHKLKYPANTMVVVIPMDSSHGQMFMEICYRESNVNS